MIVRIFLAVFISLVSGVCYLAGMIRLMSGLLIGFGILSAIFFGVVLLLPEGDSHLWTPIYGSGSAWPFFLLALVLTGIIAWLFLQKGKPAVLETISSRHFKFLGGGLFLYLCSLFLPSFLWFPSEAKLQVAQAGELGRNVVIGVCLYLVGSSLALYLIYRATRGVTEANPDLMRKFVPALFSVLHMDKMPALIAYLLIFSPETNIVFSNAAALALAGYVPLALFLVRICSDCSSDS